MDVPEGWKSLKYSDAAHVNRESLASRAIDPAQIIHYIDIASVQAPGIIGDIRVLRFAEAPSRARRVGRHGDTIISTVRPYLRAFAHLRQPAENTIVSTGFAVLTPKIGVWPEYLFQASLSPGFVEFLVGRMTGSNYPAVSAADVSEAPLLLPPLPEQRKIAAILSSVDEAIEKTQAVIDQVQVVKKGLMAELLTKGLPGRHERFKQTEIGTIPESWDITTLDHVARVQTGMAKNKNATGDMDIPYLRVANVQDGYVDLTELKTIRVDGAALERYRLRRGFVLLTEGGDADKLGRGTVWEGQIDPCVHQNHVFAVECHDRISPYFLSTYTASDRGKSYFLDAAKQTTNLASINSTQLRALPVPLPSIDEQNRIMQYVDAFRRRLASEQSTLDQLRALKSALMQSLLTGQIRVTP